MGFEPLGYRGLETGSRQTAAHVVKQNKVSNFKCKQKKMQHNFSIQQVYLILMIYDLFKGQVFRSKR